MNLEEAKQLVIEAGRDLVGSGLIARTWGNVSCRVNDELFVITPSGRNYLTLTPDEIVPIRLPSLSHKGSVEPSSEKRIHGTVYREHPDVGFIIHTHQENASVVSALGVPLPVYPEYEPTLGSLVPCAGYGLPGTKKLCLRTAAALSRTQGQAVLMKRHGVLCTGRTRADAFAVSAALEEMAGCFLDGLFDSASVKPSVSCGFQKCRRLEGGGLLLTGSDGKDYSLRPGDSLPGLERECAVLSRVFRDHPHLHFAEASSAAPVAFAAACEKPLKTWLDDFAQIIGPQLAVLPPHPEIVSRGLSRASAALIRNMGALCVGKTESDAEAARQLLEKNCLALQSAYLFEERESPDRGPKPIPFWEASLMRQNYLKRYSKKY